MPDGVKIEGNEIFINKTKFREWLEKSIQERRRVGMAGSSVLNPIVLFLMEALPFGRSSHIFYYIKDNSVEIDGHKYKAPEWVERFFKRLRAMVGEDFKEVHPKLVLEALEAEEPTSESKPKSKRKTSRRKKKQPPKEKVTAPITVQEECWWRKLHHLLRKLLGRQ